MGMKKKKSVLFINLAAFSLTGGIEKFNKCFLKALWKLSQENDWKVASYSLYDSSSEEKYFPEKKYKGFNQKKIAFVLQSVLQARKYDQVIFGHINLAIAGLLIKFIFPSKKLILITHGIEVWKPLKGIQKLFINKVDEILTASNFTKNKLCTIQKINPDKISLFYNTIDPYFTIPKSFDKPVSLQKRYQVNENDFVLFTLTRLSGTEKYKGYDIVVNCLPELLKTIPSIKYIIGGKYDKVEKQRMDDLIKKLHLENIVQIAGFLKDEEICDHYQLANIFIMPSKGEGFGIVFIEAAICGSQIIAGNLDGSVDALQNGKLGILVNPSSEKEISEAILKVYQTKHFWKKENKQTLQSQTLDYFGFAVFSKNLSEVLTEN